MKKTLKLIFMIMLALSMTFSVCAKDTRTNYDFKFSENIEVIIETKNLSDAKVETLYKELLTGIKQYPVNPNMNQIASISCTSGHDLEKGKAYRTEHNAYSSSPRCKQETYNYEACRKTDCSYSKYTLLSTVRISCH